MPGVGDDVLAGVVVLVVDAHDVHRGVGRGGGDDHLLGSLSNKIKHEKYNTPKGQAFYQNGYGSIFLPIFQWKTDFHIIS
jgi:hypothetical protein